MDNNNGQFGGQYQGQYNNQYGGQPGGQFEAPMTLGEWLVTLIVLAIPCVSLIMLFVWGFGQGNTSRKNYCRAALIVKAVVYVLVIILYAAMGAAMLGSLSSLSNY